MTTKTMIGAAVIALLPMVAGAQQAPQTEAPKGAAAKAEKKAAPQIDIAEKIKDYGTVAKGDKVNAVFDVRNTGTAPLEINQVRPTCGCTVAAFDHTIAPGGTGQIKAEVDTANFLGPISKAVLVFSNDPDTPQVNLVIKADVKAFVEVRPRPILRFNALQGEETSDTVTLVATDGSNFKITGVDTAGGPYKVTYKEAEKKAAGPNANGAQWDVTVAIPADAPEGLLNHRVTIKTDDPKAPEVPINVTGVVRPVIQVIPAEVNFATVPADAPVGRNVIVINNRQGSELAIKSAEIDATEFKVEVIPLQAGQRFQIAISLPPGASKGEHKGTLTITTNDPVRSTITVPVMANVQ